MGFRGQSEELLPGRPGWCTQTFYYGKFGPAFKGGFPVCRKSPTVPAPGHNANGLACLPFLRDTPSLEGYTCYAP